MAERWRCLWCAHRARTAKRFARGTCASPWLHHWRGAFGAGDPPGNAIGGRAGAPRPPPARAPEGSTLLRKHSLYPQATHPRRLHANGKAFVRPEGLPSPKTSRFWKSIRLALGSCARSFAVRAPVRAPKEEHWIAIGQALSTNRALPHWLVKGSCEALPLSPVSQQQQRAAHNVRRPRHQLSLRAKAFPQP